MRTDTPANALTRPASREVTRLRSANFLLWAGQIVAAADVPDGRRVQLAGAAPMVSAHVGSTSAFRTWFRHLTGTIEVISAVLLLIPSLAFFGAAAYPPPPLWSRISRISSSSAATRRCRSCCWRSLPRSRGHDGHRSDPARSLSRRLCVLCQDGSACPGGRSTDHDDAQAGHPA